MIDRHKTVAIATRVGPVSLPELFSLVRDYFTRPQCLSITPSILRYWTPAAKADFLLRKRAVLRLVCVIVLGRAVVTFLAQVL